MSNIKYYILIASALLLAVALLVIPSSYVNAQEKKAEYTLKFSSLAPQGSSWINVWDELAAYLEKTSGKRINVITYAGGVMGDEPDMIRKMRLGQLNALGVTVHGTQQLVPEMSVFGLPFLFKDWEEVDYVKEEVRPTIDKLFEKNGYKLLGWVDNGFINFYTKEPIYTPEELAKLKMWVWSGEQIAVETYKALGISPVPGQVPEVLSSLQTGLVNGIYTSPLACVALQWFTQINYVIHINIRYETAVIAMYKPSWGRINPDLQKIILEGFKIYMPKLRSYARKDQEVSLDEMAKRDIKIIELTPQEIDVFKKKTEPIWNELAGKMYPKSLLDQVLSALKEYRSGTKK